MSYELTTWKKGDVVTSAKLNKIEQGISENSDEIDVIKQSLNNTQLITIAVADWVNNSCTKNVTGVTATNTVIVTYAPSSKSVYTTADIFCSAQGTGTLTFECTTVPSDPVSINVLIL